MRGNIPKLKLHADDGESHSRDADDAIPECPKWCSKDVRKKWKEVITELASRGFANRTTPDMIAAYCQACITACNAAVTLAKEGDLVQGLHVKLPHPSLGILDRASNQIRMLSAVLGLDPISAQRLGGKAKGKTAPHVASRDRKKEPRQGTA